MKTMWKADDRTQEQPKRKRLKRGRDWHAWAFYCDAAHLRNNHLDGLSWWAEADIPPGLRNKGDGKWVRVKFEEVKP